MANVNARTKKAPRRTSLLYDQRLWKELRHAAAAVASGRGIPDAVAQRVLPLEEDGHARAALVPRTAGGYAVVVVVVEEREKELPSEAEIAKAFGLTPREAEVALLLARRQSNKEIARALDVTAHTAERHTERVLAKLGIGSRRYVRSVLLAPAPAPRRTGTGTGGAASPTSSRGPGTRSRSRRYPRMPALRPAA